MPTRATHAEKLIRSPFRARSRPATVPADSAAAAAESFDEVTVTRVTDRAHRHAATTLESELGEATYHCQCGFIWQAPVLTSVDCPHCGDSQAW